MAALVPGNDYFTQDDAPTGLTTGERTAVGGMLQVLAVLVGGAALLKVCVFDVSSDNVPMLFAALIVAIGLFAWGDSLTARQAAQDFDDEL